MINIFTYSKNEFLSFINSHNCDAIAVINGNRDYSNIKGKAEFYQINGGVLVLLEVENLPQNQTGNFFAVHIHSGENCNQDENGEFFDTPHLNLNQSTHPNHTGDLPVILSNNGYAFSVNLTDRFNVSDIIGKTLMIHEHADDFRTDPSGESGLKIACGLIKKAR